MLQTTKTLILTTLLGLFAVLSLASGAYAGGDWNDAGIAWKPYEAGMAEAKESKKPVLLVIYTDWCPHCTRYSAVFHDPKVVEKAKGFVMIRVERDANKAISAKHAPDGEYIPRTMFLDADGAMQDIHEQRQNYLYFYDTSSPDSLLRSMGEAATPAPPTASEPETAKPEAG